MPWLTFDFKKRLMNDLMEPLLAFSVVVPEQVTSTKLKATLQALEGHADVLREAEEAAASGIRTLSADNLKLIALWIPQHQRDKADALRSWIGGGKHSTLMTGAV
jgi:hypothetical protein